MKKENIVKIIKYLFIVYCIGLIFILFFSRNGRGNQFNLKVFSKEHFEMTNFIPFRTIISYLKLTTKININIVVTNLLGNLLMFTPMGMALPVLFDKKFNKLWKVTTFVIALVLIIETIQFITFTGSADIDDLILNTIGAIIGYGIIKIKMIRKFLKIDE
jgi:glycopeptide antibiotics resistance protein